MLLATTLGGLALVLLSRWLVLLLYSEAFLGAVSALQALLVGTVALSAGRVLSNDISGRGFPRLNIYTGVAAVVTNVLLNLLWIPRYEIIGAAWASTVSYTVSFLGALYFYCRLSGNRWTVVVIPQRGDWALFRRTGVMLWHWAWAKVKEVLSRCM
ncbi:MAG: polysaccharide biosynthesis C-terminal domain-containing protein [Thermoleophilia bacterium]|nr:polysaccharide biosynthesis C-terminal domain-containing protein [Thermoleophilia bacterium]